VTGYYVFQGSTELSSTVSISGTTATVSGLTEGDTYTFYVEAYNSYGTSPESAGLTVDTGEGGFIVRHTASGAVGGGAIKPEVSGNSGDNGPATSASLDAPAGLAVDAARDV
jgi:hypothetical protein